MTPVRAPRQDASCRHRFVMRTCVPMGSDASWPSVGPRGPVTCQPFHMNILATICVAASGRTVAGAEPDDDSVDGNKPTPRIGSWREDRQRMKSLHRFYLEP